jgi:hypothetical protein
VSGTQPREQAGLPTCLGNASTIAHQTAGFRELTQVITRGNSMLDRQCGELIALTEEERIGGSAPAWTWSKPCKGCIEVAFGACMDDMSVQPKRPGGHIGAFSGAAMLVHDVWSIGHQPTRFDILPNAVHRRQSRPGRQGADANAVRI